MPIFTCSGETINIAPFTFFRTGIRASAKRAFVVADVYEPLTNDEPAMIRLLELNTADRTVIEYSLNDFQGLLSAGSLIPFTPIPIP